MGSRLHGPALWLSVTNRPSLFGPYACSCLAVYDYVDDMLAEAMDDMERELCEVWKTEETSGCVPAHVDTRALDTAAVHSSSSSAVCKS